MCCWVITIRVLLRFRFRLSMMGIMYRSRDLGLLLGYTVRILVRDVVRVSLRVSPVCLPPILRYTMTVLPRHALYLAYQASTRTHLTNANHVYPHVQHAQTPQTVTPASPTCGCMAHHAWQYVLAHISIVLMVDVSLAKVHVTIVNHWLYVRLVLLGSLLIIGVLMLVLVLLAPMLILLRLCVRLVSRLVLRVRWVRLTVLLVLVGTCTIAICVCRTVRLVCTSLLSIVLTVLVFVQHAPAQHSANHVLLTI